MNQQILQLSNEAPNPVTHLSGYEPTTTYWPNIITLMNALIVSSYVHGVNAKQLQSGANLTLNTEIFEGEVHTAVEWAEIVMAINHGLWMLHAVHEENGIEELEPILQALNDLYYEWHDRALNTLTGADLSEYLRITD